MRSVGTPSRGGLVLTHRLCFSSSLRFSHQSVADLRGRFVLQPLCQVTLVLLVDLGVISSPLIGCDFLDAWSAEIPLFSFRSPEHGVADVTLRY